MLTGCQGVVVYASRCGALAPFLVFLVKCILLLTGVQHLQMFWNGDEPIVMSVGPLRAFYGQGGLHLLELGQFWVRGSTI